MLDWLTVSAILLFALSLAALVTAFLALRRRRLLGTATGLLSALLLLCFAALLGTISVAIQGYRALTHEQVAARIDTRPDGPGEFVARFHFPDGREATYRLAGDQLYVDAYILKWKPIANFFGLHTAYRLDRVAGRYRRLADEQHQPHTVYAVHDDHKILDMFRLRQRYALFRPLLDAEYGSATYIAGDRRAHYELLVSGTGLLIRRTGAGGNG